MFVFLLFPFLLFLFLFSFLFFHEKIKEDEKKTRPTMAEGGAEPGGASRQRRFCSIFVDFGQCAGLLLCGCVVSLGSNRGLKKSYFP